MHAGPPNLPSMAERSRHPYERMAKYLHQLKRTHHTLRELHGVIRVHAHVEAVWLQWTHRDREVEFEVARPQWWEPLTKSHGRELMEELARGLVRKISASQA